MKNIKTFIVAVVLLLLCACASTTNQETETSGDVEKEDVPVIYADNESINSFLVAYNEIYPEDEITSENINKYYHHGRDHDDQIKTYIAGVPVIVSAEGRNKLFNVSVYWDNPTHSSELNYDMFCAVEHVFASSLSEEQIKARWDEMLDDLTHQVSWDDGTEIWPGTAYTGGEPGGFAYVKMYG